MGHGGNHGFRDTREFYRLFMVPGMQHCAGGPGATNFSMVEPLEQWVEHVNRARTSDRVAHDQRYSRPNAAALRVSLRGAVEGHGQHRQGRELHLCFAGASVNPTVLSASRSPDRLLFA